MPTSKIDLEIRARFPLWNACTKRSAAGAYSSSHVYTRDDVRQVISYAATLGIAVMPEFDTPGHMSAGYNAIPNLLTECYDPTTKQPSGATGPINPILNSTYDFATKFFGKQVDIFRDAAILVRGKSCRETFVARDASWLILDRRCFTSLPLQLFAYWWG